MHSLELPDAEASLPAEGAKDSPGPKSEAATKRRPSSGKGAVLQSMGARALIVLANAATGILTARALHPSGRGELAAMSVWPTFLGSLMALGLPSALVFYSKRDKSEQASLYWTSMIVAAAVGVFATAAGILAVPVWLAKYSPHVVTMAQIFMLSTPVGIFTAIGRASCESRGDFFASSVSMCMTPAVSLFVLLGFQLSGHLDPTTAAIGYLSGGVPTCLWLMFRVAGSLERAQLQVAHHARLLLRYGLRSYGADLCGTLSLYADQVLVVRILSAEAMGTYTVALSLSRLIGVVQTAVASVLFPKLLQLGTDATVALTGRASRISVFLSTIGGAGLAVVSPLLLPLLYGHEYEGVSVLLSVLLLEAIFTGTTLILTQAHLALGRPGLVTILQSTGILISVPLLFVLVPVYGTLGAAIALLIASIVRLGLTLTSFRWGLRTQCPRILPVKKELEQLVQQIAAQLRAKLRKGTLQPLTADSREA